MVVICLFKLISERTRQIVEYHDLGAQLRLHSNTELLQTQTPVVIDVHLPEHLIRFLSGYRANQPNLLEPSVQLIPIESPTFILVKLIKQCYDVLLHALVLLDFLI